MMMITQTERATAGQGTLLVGGIGAASQLMVIMSIIMMAMMMMMA